MAQIIGLPKLSPTMEEGVLVRWVKKKGDAVSPGDLVAEVETDKANMDFNMEDEGVLLELLVGEGETVKLGAPVAILGKAGEDVSALVKQARAGGDGEGGAAKAEQKPAKAEQKPAKAEQKPARAEAKAEQKPAKAEAKAEKAKPAPSDAGGEEQAPGEAPPHVVEAKKPTGTGTGTGKGAGTGAGAGASAGKILASPLAKTLALELGVDLRQVDGTGPGGRIVERDVRAAAEGGAGAGDDSEHVTAEPIDDQPQGGTAIAVVRNALARPPADTDYEDRPLSGMRKTIASRLTAAKRDVPHFRLTAQIDAGPLLDFRQRLNGLLGDRGKISVNDLILKGAALALRRVPEANAAFAGDAIRYFTRVHLGVAVALEQGLITPVVRDADLKGIGVISAEVKDLIERAKRRELKTQDIQGSTFTVSNLGMFPIDQFDAIINPPEACILAVGRIAKQPVVDNERIAIGERMNVTLSCDHRVVDGAVGARWLQAFIELLERPESLAL
jgi:pyruvate dehydrogenase E2 component (dihydrolipoamide acetyltransferase)